MAKKKSNSENVVAKVNEYVSSTADILTENSDELLISKNYFVLLIVKFQKTHFSIFHLSHAATLRKHAYSNILKILPSKNENFQIKNSDIFPISAQNIVCGYSLEPPRRGGPNEYPQSMILSRNKKNSVYPCKP